MAVRSFGRSASVRLQVVLASTLALLLLAYDLHQSWQVSFFYSLVVPSSQQYSVCVKSPKTYSMLTPLPLNLPLQQSASMTLLAIPSLGHLTSAIPKVLMFILSTSSHTFVVVLPSEWEAPPLQVQVITLSLLLTHHCVANMTL